MQRRCCRIRLLQDGYERATVQTWEEGRVRSKMKDSENLGPEVT